MNLFRTMSLLAIAVFGLLNLSYGASAADSPPLVDRSSSAAASGTFSYRKVASSHHPATLVGDWSVKIASEAQLFVDDYLVHSMQGLKRTLHQPRKHPQNPVLTAERPWETDSRWGEMVWANGTVIQDGRGQWRMYYNAGKRAGCLATSDDLLEWHRPSLELYEHNGSKANNIVFDTEGVRYDTISVIRDENESDPERRWKAAIYHYGTSGVRDGLYAYYSADGIHWERRPEPIMVSYSVGRGWADAWSDAWPMPGIGDVVAVTWDPRLERFAAHVKLISFRGEKYFRSRGMCESDDFIHWTRPRVTLLPDEDDADDVHLYGNTAWPYESMWLGTLRAYHEEVGNVDLQLISSRDGRHWERAGGRKAFIPNGPPGSYDEGYHTEFTNAPMAVDDELWFFYGSTTTPGKNHIGQWQGGICLATLRRDGFVSLDAGDQEGWIMTRPLTHDGTRLFVNADADEGELRVEAVHFGFNSEPEIVEGLSRANCVPVREDGTSREVRWSDDRNLASAPKTGLCLKFYLKNASLYSFTIK